MVRGTQPIGRPQFEEESPIMAEFSSGQEKAQVPLGLYVHVPFCASTCDFCAFYQTKPTAGAVDRFLSAIDREATLVAESRPLTTVFWGGCTPGLLAPADLGRLAGVVRNRFRGQPAEWTVEL